ncbi:hypothetical protein [Bacillus wiedmannii]|uniref:hypothetical protein n=1 Tax=Bacillus wiedmannii TaxID=1890302 RepID=UPI000BF1B2E9|nr:hypothetical protein [Bacillus wiedmannii]PEM08550.1 hypothetical protein CN610_20065 [Bacillus wiedmannii]
MSNTYYAIKEKEVNLFVKKMLDTGDTLFLQPVVTTIKSAAIVYTSIQAVTDAIALLEDNNEFEFVEV